MASVSINRQEIARMTREIQREFDKHPIRVPVQADPPAPPGGLGMGGTTIFNGPVIHGSADGAQLAWGNDTVHQVQNPTEHIPPGFQPVPHPLLNPLTHLSAPALPY